MMVPGSFREALRMQKPHPLLMLLGSVWPVHDVIRWQVREEMLDDLARKVREQPSSAKLAAELMDIAGRDWHLLHEELMARWAAVKTKGTT